MKKIRVVIIDYGVGNTHSVSNAIRFLGYDRLVISANARDIADADALVLPGVGAFNAAMSNLESRGLRPILNEQVLERGKPILGICVGMQMLASVSEENGLHDGLDWIEGRVKKLELPAGFVVPHVGWNDLKLMKRDPLFASTADRANFYFDHSYWFDCPERYVTSWCEYGRRITASVQRDNIFGVQFHPEKSQTTGLKMFRSFFNAIK